MSVEHRTAELTAVLTACRPLAVGALAVNWSISGKANGEGDGLFVDASCAASEWCAVADALIQPCPPSTHSAEDVARSHLMDGAVLVFVAVQPTRWLAVCAEGGQLHISARLPGQELTLMASLYAWLACGQRLAGWPFRLSNGPARRVPSAGPG
jgi:hypothetical protein